MPDRPDLDLARIWTEMRMKVSEEPINDYKTQIVAFIGSYLAQLHEQGFDVVRVDGDDPLNPQTALRDRCERLRAAFVAEKQRREFTEDTPEYHEATMKIMRTLAAITESDLADDLITDGR
jgi:hypothetical protein